MADARPSSSSGVSSIRHGRIVTSEVGDPIGGGARAGKAQECVQVWARDTRKRAPSGKLAEQKAANAPCYRLFIYITTVRSTVVRSEAKEARETGPVPCAADLTPRAPLPGRPAAAEPSGKFTVDRADRPIVRSD
ncbi:unnamed protein product [Soboliphyme baturini]|uniref:Uncharacterized protein n=1 Tax=Soboliphyme baturini TaxID=241478 RepID=A0A183J1C3_9BILA|nr:unnamed protein product [Soboliphyme baturini]